MREGKIQSRGSKTYILPTSLPYIKTFYLLFYIRGPMLNQNNITHLYLTKDKLVFLPFNKKNKSVLFHSKRIIYKLHN